MTDGRGGVMQASSSDYVQLEIRRDALKGLINEGVLVIEDVRALNQQSRQGVRDILLASIRTRS